MKIRRSILIVGAATGLLIVLLVWFTKKPKEVATQITPSPQSAVEQPATKSNATPSATPPVAQIATAQTQDSTNVQTSPERNKGQIIQEVLSNQNNVPIVFYGKLEDQFGNPVVGAQIAGNTIIYSGFHSGSAHISATSDANGNFEIDAGSGESLGIVPKKPGYALATTTTEFKYSGLYENHHAPDRNNPVVIKMWKLQGAEPLMSIDQHFKIPFTSAPIYFDLTTGKIVENGGDLKITVSRPAGSISERNPQDWAFKIEAVDGGLMEAPGDSGVTYQAPDSGYESSDTLTASSNHHGIGVIQQDFFLKCRNGQIYTKVGVTVGINKSPDGPMSIAFNGVANTNGSRNWEGSLSSLNQGTQ
jgi:hypothetical protein